MYSLILLFFCPVLVIYFIFIPIFTPAIPSLAPFSCIVYYWFWLHLFFIVLVVTSVFIANGSGGRLSMLLQWLLFLAPCSFPLSSTNLYVYCLHFLLLVFHLHSLSRLSPSWYCILYSVGVVAVAITSSFCWLLGCVRCDYFFAYSIWTV